MDPQIAVRRTYFSTRPLGAAVAELNSGLTELARIASDLTGRVVNAVRGWVDFLPAPARPPRSPRITYRPIKPPPPEALPLLTEAIVGSTKYTIAKVLGALRSAVIEGLAAIEADAHAAYLQTDIWYYALPRHGQLAMAVTFAGDIAQNVEFFRAPGVEPFTDDEM